jgi:hypothetical protein
MGKMKEHYMDICESIAIELVSFAEDGDIDEQAQALFNAYCNDELNIIALAKATGVVYDLEEDGEIKETINI